MSTIKKRTQALIKPYNSKQLYDFPFLLVLLFLFFDYGRPQSFLPGLGSLHIPMFIQVLLGLSLLLANKLLNIKNIQSGCFVALVALMALHVPIAVNNYYAYQTTRTMILYLIVYLSIVNFVDSFPRVLKFIKIWIIINAVCAFIGTIQGGRVVNSSFMGDENDFALVMNMAIPFAYFMFLGTKSFKKKLFYLFAVGLFIAAIVASFSRGGFIGLIAVIGYCWYKTPKKVLATVLIVMIIGILSFFTTDKYWDEMETIQQENIEEGTGGSRCYLWKIGWRIFLDHPIIGSGPGNYSCNVAPYEPSAGYLGKSRAGRAAHSLYFTLIPELGLIGIFLFGTMLYYMQKDKSWALNLEKRFNALPVKNSNGPIVNQTSFVYELHKLKFIIFGINGALLGYLVSGIFISVLYYPHFWLLMAISVALKNVVQKRVEELQLD